MKLLILLISLFLLNGNLFAPSVIGNYSVPFVASSPGQYIVVEDITYTATSATPVIIVASNDVVVNLMNFTVSQTSGYGFTVTGIQVQSGLSNVNIINGSVSGFTQSGISVASGNNGVSISNVSVSSCGNRGIEFIGTAASPVIEGEIINCSLLSNCTVATADYALTLTNVNYTIVSNSVIDLNGSSVITGTFACIRATGFRNQFLNLTMNDNLGNTDARGISLNKADQTLIRLCMVNNLTAVGGGGSCSAYQCEAFSTSTGNIFQQCIARSCNGVFATDGFLSSTLCDDNVFDTCLSVLNNASATTGVCTGFRAVNNNRNNFLYCRARHNTAPASTVAAPLYGAYGFFMNYTTSVSVVQCIGEDTSASTRAVGFALLTPNTLNNFWNNFASRNTTFGFDYIGTQATYANQGFIQNLAISNGGGAGAQYNTNAAVSGFPAASKNDNTSPSVLNTTAPNAWTNVGIT